MATVNSSKFFPWSLDYFTISITLSAWI
jgi:hypothetical protein